MPTIELLVGMIASGKSTYARRRADQGALVVAHDDLTRMLHGGAYRYEPGLRDIYREMEEWLVLEAAEAGRDVIIDRTHLTRESRRRWLDFALMTLPRFLVGNPSIPVIAVAFPILPAEIHAARRSMYDARGRSAAEWLAVARHHAEQAAAEPLGPDEGFGRIIRIEAIDGPEAGREGV